MHSKLNVLYFLNWCSYLGVRLTNTFAGRERKDTYTWKRHRTKIEDGILSQIDFIGVSMGLPSKCYIPPVHEEDPQHNPGPVFQPRAQDQPRARVPSCTPHNQAGGDYHHIKTSDHRPVVTFAELDNNFALTGFEKMTKVKDGSPSMTSTRIFT